MKALLICVLVAGLGVGGWFVYGFFDAENLARRPPELDALRTEILKGTRLEANLQQVDVGARLNIVFPHVPAKADKAEIERTARALVKKHLPTVREVDVQFGDNLSSGRKVNAERRAGTEGVVDKLLGLEAPP